jgi:putative DNA primase/helicase
MFTKYKEYCNNAGFRPVSQAIFNKDVESANEKITKSVDKLGKRRTFRSIKLSN